MRTSRARRRRLHVVEEPNPGRRENGPREPQEASPAIDGETAQADGAEQADLDAISTGMAAMLRMALRLMKSYDASPGRVPSRW
jgi:hypothetical protein